MKIAITGKPGVGKTTLLENIWKRLKGSYKIAGFITKEIRENNRRIGFILINLSNNKKEILASSKVKYSNIKVGKYYVNIRGFENFLKEVENEIRKICKEKVVILIDEIGPMELKNDHFKNFIFKLLKSNLLVIATLHWKLKEYRKYFDKIFEITLENRNFIINDIVKLIYEVLNNNNTKS